MLLSAPAINDSRIDLGVMIKPDSFLHSLLPKDDTFFEPVERAPENLLTATRILEELMSNSILKEERAQNIRRIEDAEHRGKDPILLTEGQKAVGGSRNGNGQVGRCFHCYRKHHREERLKRFWANRDAGLRSFGWDLISEFNCAIFSAATCRMFAFGGRPNHHPNPPYAFRS